VCVCVCVCGKAQCVRHLKIIVSVFRVSFYEPRERKNLFRDDFFSGTRYIFSSYKRNRRFGDGISFLPQVKV